jgi:CheY-like chemotaxis protein
MKERNSVWVVDDKSKSLGIAGMGKKTSILVVDDEPSGFDVIEAHLFRERYDLSYASSGIKALNLIDSLEPDVILLDVMMPEMDGIEVCRHIKSDPQWQHIPIIMVTALTSKEDLARSLDAGADDFLTKPISGVELRARVRSMLRIKQQYDALEATLQLREDLSNMIVHDLRNPLTTILMSSSLLVENDYFISTGTLRPSADSLPSGWIDSPSMKERNIQAICSCASISPVRKSAVPWSPYLSEHWSTWSRRLRITNS